MEKHDFRAALEQFKRDDLNALELTAPTYAEALLAALRSAASRQEAEEAVERGEAVKVRTSVEVFENGQWRVNPARTEAMVGPTKGGAVLSAIVPLPQPLEIEAEVETHD